MIVDLPNTTTAAISKKLVRLRQDVGAMTLARVLTLVIVADSETGADEAIEAANDASRQHPCRIIALVGSDTSGSSRLDAQIRVGGDAGAGEVVSCGCMARSPGTATAFCCPCCWPTPLWWRGGPRMLPRTPPGRRSGRWRSDGSPTAPRPTTR